MNWVLLTVVLAIVFGGGGTLIFLLLKRKEKMYMMTIQDMANPNNKEIKRYALLDTKNGVIKLYKAFWSPLETAMHAPFQLAAYDWGNKRILAYVGATGNPEDTNIVPVHKPLVSKASAREFSDEVSGAFMKNMDNILIAQNYSIGDEVRYTPAADEKLVDKVGGRIVDAATEKMTGQKKGALTIDGKITNIDYNGIGITFDEPLKTFNDKEGVAIKGIEYDEKNIARENFVGVVVPYEFVHNPKIVVTKRNKDARRDIEAYTNSFFSTEWIMQTFGIVPIEDENVVLANHKTAVSSFNSKMIERRDSKRSWLERNIVVVYLLFMGIGMGMFLLLGYSGFGQFLKDIAANNAVTNQAAQSVINQLAHIAGVQGTGGGVTPT